MATIKIVTFADKEEVWEYSFTSFLKHEYCRLHGYRFCFHGDKVEKSKPNALQIPFVCRAELENSDWVFYMARDAAPVDFVKPLEDIISEYAAKGAHVIVSRQNSYHLDDGVVFVRNSAPGRAFLGEWCSHMVAGNSMGVVTALETAFGNLGGNGAISASFKEFNSKPWNSPEPVPKRYAQGDFIARSGGLEISPQLSMHALRRREISEFWESEIERLRPYMQEEAKVRQRTLPRTMGRNVGVHSEGKMNAIVFQFRGGVPEWVHEATAVVNKAYCEACGATYVASDSPDWVSALNQAARRLTQCDWMVLLDAQTAIGGWIPIRRAVANYGRGKNIVAGVADLYSHSFADGCVLLRNSRWTFSFLRDLTSERFGAGTHASLAERLSRAYAANHGGCRSFIGDAYPSGALTGVSGLRGNAAYSHGVSFAMRSSGDLCDATPFTSQGSEFAREMTSLYERLKGEGRLERGRFIEKLEFFKGGAEMVREPIQLADVVAEKKQAETLAKRDEKPVPKPVETPAEEKNEQASSSASPWNYKYPRF